VEKYEENNPLSQLAIVLLRDRRSILLCDFDISKEEKLRILHELIHINDKSSREFNLHSTLQIKAVDEKEPFGQISLYNGFERARKLFQTTPLYFHKEVHLILGSSGTNDHSDPLQPVLELARDGTRVHVISMNGRAFILEKITELSRGNLEVPHCAGEFEETIQAS